MDQAVVVPEAGVEVDASAPKVMVIFPSNSVHIFCNSVLFLLL